MKKEIKKINIKTSVLEKKNNKSLAKPDKKELSKAVPHTHEVNRLLEGIFLPQRVIAQIAEEVAMRVTNRLKRPSVDKATLQKNLENPLFLDTSAIIDGRIFELIRMGVFTGTYVVVDGVLDELKHIADSKDLTKKERGRKGLTLLEHLRKDKNIKFETYDDSDIKKPVDERIIDVAKITKGKIITCDFNLSKKAQISNVVAIDMYEMANVLKITALPGEAFFIKVIQKGKGDRQGVGYLPDGTMVVVEEGENLIDETVKVLISRVIQTDVGRIFFGKIVG